jgi:hypothetical protein
MIPFILVITLHDRKPLFCVFLAFRDLNEVKLRTLEMPMFHQEKRLKHLDLTRWVRRAKRDMVTRPVRRIFPPRPYDSLDSFANRLSLT